MGALAVTHPVNYTGTTVTSSGVLQRPELVAILGGENPQIVTLARNILRRVQERSNAQPEMYRGHYGNVFAFTGDQAKKVKEIVSHI